MAYKFYIKATETSVDNSVIFTLVVAEKKQAKILDGILLDNKINYAVNEYQPETEVKLHD